MERKINKRALIEALRCSVSVGTDCQKGCPYRTENPVDGKLPVPPDYINDEGVAMYVSCDFEQMTADAIELLEKLPETEEEPC